MLRRMARGDEERRPAKDVFPRESHGNDYALNWALNQYSVTPTGEAFRNLSDSALVARAQGTLSSTHALCVQEDAPVPVTVVGRDMTLESYRALSTLARRHHLSEAATLFVHDAAVGAGSIRVVTDDAAAALFASHTLAPLPKSQRGSPEEFVHPFSAFVAQNLRISNPKQYGLSSDRAIIVNPATGTSVLIGAPLTGLREALSVIVTEQARANEEVTSVPFACDIVQYGDASAVVVGATDSIRTGGLRRYMAGAHMAAWTAAGVQPLFRGATFAGVKADDSERGNLVLTQGKQSSVVAPCAGAGRLVTAPAALVVMTSTKAAKTKVSAQEGAKLIADGAAGAQLAQWIEASGCKVFVLNSDNKLPAIEKAMVEIFQGKE